MATAAHQQFEFDERRFKELVLFISDLCQDDATFGSVKLNKILYFADFMAYRVLGRPITGATYIKLSEGPAPQQLPAARDDLIAEGRIAIEQRPYFNGVQKRPVTLGKRPDDSIFSESEREIVSSIADYFQGKTAREVSDFSHLQPGWILADDRAVIPYETAWLSADPVDQLDEAVAQEMADNYFRSRIRSSSLS